MQGLRGSRVGPIEPRGSRGRPTGSQVVKGQAHRVPGDQGVGLMCRKGSRGRPTGSQGVRGWAYRVPGNQGIGLQGPSVFLLVQENEDDHLHQ